MKKTIERTFNGTKGLKKDLKKAGFKILETTKLEGGELQIRVSKEIEETTPTKPIKQKPKEERVELFGNQKQLDLYLRKGFKIISEVRSGNRLHVLLIR